MINKEVLSSITYGLYIVCSGDKMKGNGYIANTVFQVSSSPSLFTICSNKQNFTTELIHKHGHFSISILDKNTPADLFATFGYKSGRDIDKLKEVNIRYGETGSPIVLDHSIASIECKVLQRIDAGSHIMFVGEMISAEIINTSLEPLSYQYYREVKKGLTPKNAPTYIEEKNENMETKKFQCPGCIYIYDEAAEDIKFSDLPDDWACPICGTPKEDFIEID